MNKERLIYGFAGLLVFFSMIGSIIWMEDYAVDVDKVCSENNGTFNNEQTDCGNLRHLMLDICEVSCINANSTIYEPLK